MNNGLEKFREECRNRYLKAKRKQLRNKDICLVASNCNGATILHDLGLQFRSPFVNLWIPPKDYLRMLDNLEEYMGYDLRFIKDEKREYPVGVLKDVKIYFKHYKTEEEAKTKWIERTKRMDFEHIFVLFTDRDGCTQQDLEAFDQIKWKNKVVFVNKPHPEIKSSVYIRGFEDQQNVGMCMYYKNRFSYKKYYDDFNYVQWFNEGM